jgi:diguanylate cyclase (GGDEF)-like protein
MAVKSDLQHPLEALAASIREAAWYLALEVVDEGLNSNAVPSLARLEGIHQLGDIPSFIGALGQELADPRPDRLAAAGPLLKLAREHAAKREQLGFAPREVLMEFLVLRRVLWRALSQQRDLLDAADPLVVEHRLDAAFDQLEVECAVAYFDRSTAELAKRARCDALTGALNHQAFCQEVGAELQRAHRYGHGVSFDFLDVDRFKEINDTLGHQAGDRVLCAVSELLGRDVRDSDRVGRLGGDEFAVCLVESDPCSGPAFLNRFHEHVAELAAAPGFPEQLTVSAGCAHYPTEAASAEALFELADARLYESKRAKKAEPGPRAYAP